MLNQPYYNFTQPQQTAGQFSEVMTVFVSNESEVLSYPVPQGRTILFLDAQNSMPYLKSNTNGWPDPPRRFKISEIVSTPSSPIQNGVEYVTKEQFDELKQMMENLTKQLGG